MRICWGLDSNLAGRPKTNAVDAEALRFRSGCGGKTNAMYAIFLQCTWRSVAVAGAVVARFALWRQTAAAIFVGEGSLWE